ncbi:glycosyltransferase family 2 protein [Candidatus Uhrbacteria bacterium]|nr:glycosyltransferase family 2 protein [Candidatus Uhrbacteria bacterium]
MSRISVIIPTYQHAETLPSVLDSILNQSRKPDEIIVINDGSTDNTEAVLAPYQEHITYFSQKNQGAPTARNLGFTHSRGEYVIFWDADVIGEPTMLERLETALENHPEASWAYSSFCWGKKLFLSTYFDQEKLRKENFIHTSALIRRDVSPRFDESLRRFQDWDLWLTLSQSGKQGIFVDEPLYRVLVASGRPSLSKWIPKFLYHIPWKHIGWTPRVIQEHQRAREIIVKKHHL